MTKFKPGDIVKINKKWLADYEDPDTCYVVVEDLTDEVFSNGRVRVMIEAKNSILGYYTYVYSYDMVYKVKNILSNLFTNKK